MDREPLSLSVTLSLSLSLSCAGISKKWGGLRKNFACHDGNISLSFYIDLLLYTSGPISLKERLLHFLNKLLVKQVKSFYLLLDLDPFIFLCSLHNIKYI